MIYFQNIISSLHSFWREHGCISLESHDIEVGAATLAPYTLFYCLQKPKWNICHTQFCRRPTDGRYAENPNRLSGYYQFQVVLKPSPENIQNIYLESLKIFGITPQTHDIRFIQDDWENPSIGASGLGFEVWINGMECTQWTYMQQIGGIELDVIPCEITYGLERIAMYIQNKENIFDIEWNKDGVLYRDVFYDREVQFSHYYRSHANVDSIRTHFEDAKKEAENLTLLSVYLPAYEQCIKASNFLNILDARGVLSQVERTNYILQVRELVKNICIKLLS